MSSDSPFLHSYESDGQEILFHSLTLEFYSSQDDAPSPAAEQKLLKAMALRSLALAAPDAADRIVDGMERAGLLRG